MIDCIEETINGFNEQINDYKLQEKFPEQEILVSLTTFNHDVFVDLDCVKPNKLKEMKTEKKLDHGLNFDDHIYINPLD